MKRIVRDHAHQRTPPQRRSGAFPAQFHASKKAGFGQEKARRIRLRQVGGKL
jgi:hypothetical protein